MNDVDGTQDWRFAHADAHVALSGIGVLPPDGHGGNGRRHHVG
ncbi:MAG: hypothetical protein ACRDRJ_24050 [Streptosporangiaceae bacterium]